MKKSAWYFYSLAVWILSLVTCVAVWFTGMHNTYAVVFFLIAPEWIAFIHIGRCEKLTQYEIILECPKVLKRVYLCCFAYGIINFLLGMYLLRDGGPNIYEGMYCLWNHGFIREITESAYKSFKITEGRMFTGNFLIFSTISTAFFTAREKIRLSKNLQDKECNIV